jgi:hypothetical protein
MGTVDVEMSEGPLARNRGTFFHILEESGDGRREIRIRRIILASHFLLHESITDATNTFTHRFHSVPCRDLSRCGRLLW